MGSNRRLNCRLMARHRGPVLVDTNVIIESHRVAAWRALTGGYRVETVEECVVETQAGAQRRRPKRRIDETELRGSLSAIHSVSDVERAELTLRKQDIALNIGEESLWGSCSESRQPLDFVRPGPRESPLRHSSWAPRANCATGTTDFRRRTPSTSTLASRLHSTVASDDAR